MTVLVNITFLETPTTITEKTQEQKCKDEICLEYYLSFSIISPLFHSISILSKLTKLLIVFCITLYVSEPSKCVVVFLFTLFHLKTFFICSYIQIFTEVAARKCSVKKVFLQILYNSWEKTYGRVSFLVKLLAWGKTPVVEHLWWLLLCLRMLTFQIWRTGLHMRQKLTIEASIIATSALCVFAYHKLQEINSPEYKPILV